MHYEFNISRHGIHLFATHERSCNTEEYAEKLYKLFCEKFTKEDSYTVTCSKQVSYGMEVKFDGK